MFEKKGCVMIYYGLGVELIIKFYENESFKYFNVIYI